MRIARILLDPGTAAEDVFEDQTRLSGLDVRVSRKIERDILPDAFGIRGDRVAEEVKGPCHKEDVEDALFVRQPPAEFK